MKSNCKFLFFSILLILGLILANCGMFKSLDPTGTLDDDSDDVAVSGSFDEDTMTTALPALLSAALPASSSSYMKKVKYSAEDVADNVLIVGLAIKCLLNALSSDSADDLAKCLSTAVLNADGTYKNLSLPADEARLLVGWNTGTEEILFYMLDSGVNFAAGTAVKTVSTCDETGKCETTYTVEKGKEGSAVPADSDTNLAKGEYQLTFDSIKGADSSVLKNRFKNPVLKRILKLQSAPPPQNQQGHQPPQGQGEGENHNDGPQPGDKIKIFFHKEEMANADIVAFFTNHPEFGVKPEDVSPNDVGILAAIVEGDEAPTVAAYQVYNTEDGNVLVWKFHEKHNFNRGCMALNSDNICVDATEMTITIKDPSEAKEAVKLKIQERHQLLCDNSDAKVALEDQGDAQGDQDITLRATMKLITESDLTFEQYIAKALGSDDNSVKISAKLIPSQTFFTHGSCSTQHSTGYDTTAASNLITALCPSKVNSILTDLTQNESAEMDVEFGTSGGVGYLKVCGVEVSSTIVDFSEDPMYDMYSQKYLCDTKPVDNPSDCGSGHTLYALEVEAHARNDARSGGKTEGDARFTLREGGCQEWGKLKAQGPGGPGGPQPQFNEPCASELMITTDYSRLLQAGQDYVDPQYQGQQNCYFIPQDNIKPNPACDSNYKDGINLCYKINNDGTAHVDISNFNGSKKLFESDEAQMFFNQISWDVESGNGLYEGTITFGGAQCSYHPGDQISLTVSLNDGACLISADVANCGFGQPQGGQSNAELLIIDQLFSKDNADISFYYDQTCTTDDIHKIFGQHFDPTTCSCYWDYQTYTNKCSDTCPSFSFDVLPAKEGSDANLYVSLMSSLETDPIANNIKIPIDYYESSGFSIYYSDPTSKLEHSYSFYQWGTGTNDHNYDGSISINNYSNSNTYCHAEVRFHNPSFQQ